MSRGLPVVLTGDVNARFDDPDFGVLLAAAALVPTATDCDLDAVLVRGGAAHDLRPVKVVRVLEEQVEVAGEACFLSDHAALLVDIAVPACGAGGCAETGVSRGQGSAVGAPQLEAYRRARDVVSAAAGAARTLLGVAALCGVLALVAAVVAWRRTRSAARPWLLRVAALAAALAALYAAWLAVGYAPHTLDGLAAVERRLEIGASVHAPPPP
jgi:hypothetical protein